MSEAMHRAPHEADPLSWFSGALVPAVFGGLAMTFGVVVTLTAHRPNFTPWFDWAALGVLLLGFGVLWYFSRLEEGIPSLGATFVPALFGWVSFLLSSIGHIDGSRVTVEIWWAPIGLAFLVASLTPYSSATRLLVVGSTTAIFTFAVILWVPFNRAERWPPFTEALIGSGPVLVAVAAGSVFAYQVSMRIERWALTDPGSSLTSGVLGESAKLLILRNEVASVVDRVVPLLRKVAESGVVTAEDRLQAQQLSEEVRAELVEKSNRSWLDTLAPRMNLSILDTEHRADQMTTHQRAALLGLLKAATESADGVRSAIVIQLRGEPDGSTAVALSTDVNFPEGRRITLLAPHYFTLKATVDSLKWADGEQLRLRFRLPPTSKLPGKNAGDVD